MINQLFTPGNLNRLLHFGMLEQNAYVVFGNFPQGSCVYIFE